jgi:hypothetical protein
MKLARIALSKLTYLETADQEKQCSRDASTFGLADEIRFNLLGRPIERNDDIGNSAEFQPCSFAD